MSCRWKNVPTLEQSPLNLLDCRRWDRTTPEGNGCSQMLSPAQQHSLSAEMGGPVQQPEEPRFQGHIPTAVLAISEHHRLQGLSLLSPSHCKLHYRRAGCTGLTLDISDFPCNQTDNEFENKLSNTAALLKPDELSFGFVTLLFQLVLE